MDQADVRREAAEFVAAGVPEIGSIRSDIFGTFWARKPSSVTVIPVDEFIHAEVGQLPAWGREDETALSGGTAGLIGLIAVNAHVVGYPACARAGGDVEVAKIVDRIPGPGNRSKQPPKRETRWVGCDGRVWAFGKERGSSGIFRRYELICSAVGQVLGPSLLPNMFIGTGRRKEPERLVFAEGGSQRVGGYQAKMILAPFVRPAISTVTGWATFADPISASGTGALDPYAAVVPYSNW